MNRFTIQQPCSSTYLLVKDRDIIHCTISIHKNMVRVLHVFFLHYYYSVSLLCFKKSLSINQPTLRSKWMSENSDSLTHTSDFPVQKFKQGEHLPPL